MYYPYSQNKEEREGGDDAGFGDYPRMKVEKSKGQNAERAQSNRTWGGGGEPMSSLYKTHSAGVWVEVSLFSTGDPRGTGQHSSYMTNITLPKYHPKFRAMGIGWQSFQSGPGLGKWLCGVDDFRKLTAPGIILYFSKTLETEITHSFHLLPQLSLKFWR